jgi:hypothetical protein
MKQSTSSILSGAREPERASSSNSGDARSVAPMKSVSVAATSSDASTVGVSGTIAPAMHAHVSTSSCAHIRCTERVIVCAAGARF